MPSPAATCSPGTAPAIPPICCRRWCSPSATTAPARGCFASRCLRASPRPGAGRTPTAEISNKRLFPLTGEIVEVYIDPVEGRFCRFEGRWKLTGAERTPLLVSFRQTRDCRGRDGWVGVVPADATGTTRERPRR